MIYEIVRCLTQLVFSWGGKQKKAKSLWQRKKEERDSAGRAREAPADRRRRAARHFRGAPRRGRRGPLARPAARIFFRSQKGIFVAKDAHYLHVTYLPIYSFLLHFHILKDRMRNEVLKATGIGVEVPSHSRLCAPAVTSGWTVYQSLT